MSSYHHPSDPENKPEEEFPEESQKRKFPDFVFVDNGKQQSYQEGSQKFRAEYYESLESMKKQRYPITVRIFCFTAALLLSMAILIAIPFLLVFCAINIITFFKMEAFWEQTVRLWNYFKKSLIMVLGLFLAIFSPPLGVGLIMVYFMMQGQTGEDEFVTRIMKSRFGQPRG